jgi:hypothetical protein
MITKKNGKQKIDTAKINEAVKFYLNDIKDGSKYLRASDVKGLSFSDLLTVCQTKKQWHIALVRKIVNAIGGSAYQENLESMNKQILAYSKTIK